jgi:hypothetical protein
VSSLAIVVFLGGVEMVKEGPAGVILMILDVVCVLGGGVFDVFVVCMLIELENEMIDLIAL